MIPVLIGAGVSALMPLLSEMMRDKPDPEAAKLLIESKRAEMVDKAVGAGLDRKKAEAQVDAEIQKGFAEAERQGQFNFPGGEMIGMAILGGVGGGLGSMALKKFAPGLAGKLGMGKDAASKVSDVDDVAKAAAAGPSPADVTMAKAGGIPLTRGKAVVGPREQANVSEMMGGSSAQATGPDLPLSYGRTVVTSGGGNVPRMLGEAVPEPPIPFASQSGSSVVGRGSGVTPQMLGAPTVEGPFPLAAQSGSSVVGRGSGVTPQMLGAPSVDTPFPVSQSGSSVVGRGNVDVSGMLGGTPSASVPFASQSGSSVVGSGSRDIMGMMGGPVAPSAQFAAQSGSSVVGRGASEVAGMLGKDAIGAALKPGASIGNTRLGRKFKIDAIEKGRVKMSGPDGDWEMPLNKLVDDIASDGEWAIG